MLFSVVSGRSLSFGKGRKPAGGGGGLWVSSVDFRKLESFRFAEW